MATVRKVEDPDVAEDLETKGALFDIETAEGKFKVVLPPLDGADNERD
ncbi:MAG: hypothetical protein QOD30_167 [Actinomycetota bacterium]|nr:hypothetical protein [Actinomycetota bacterium]